MAYHKSQRIARIAATVTIVPAGELFLASSADLPPPPAARWRDAVASELCTSRGRSLATPRQPTLPQPPASYQQSSWCGDLQIGHSTMTWPSSMPNLHSGHCLAICSECFSTTMLGSAKMGSPFQNTVSTVTSTDWPADPPFGNGETRKPYGRSERSQVVARRSLSGITFWDGCGASLPRREPDGGVTGHAEDTGPIP